MSKKLPLQLIQIYRRICLQIFPGHFLNKMSSEKNAKNAWPVIHEKGKMGTDRGQTKNNLHLPLL
jgi:hypothetical protein